MSNCSVCGANFPETRFVCEYCGHVETERVKQVSDTKAVEVSFSDSMKIITENLNALYEIHIPSAKEGILEIIRFVMIIQTWGIVAAFWKKPKKRFKREDYNKLKGIVKRNILQLKLSSTGSQDLISKIGVVEQELHDIDKEISKGVRAKQITLFAVIGFYVLFIISYMFLIGSLNKL